MELELYRGSTCKELEGEDYCFKITGLEESDLGIEESDIEESDIEESDLEESDIEESDLGIEVIEDV